jgi:alpha-amylase
MPTLSLSFKVHIPFRLNDYATGNTGEYFNNDAAKNMIDKLSDECYLPANQIILAAIQQQQGKFKLAFSISGSTIELLQLYRPDVIDSFRQLTETGCVELLAETYYNSLSWLYSKKEFQYQVEKHSTLIQKTFGLAPAVLRNTELIYNNDLARFAAGLGYKGILCEGLEKILQGRSPNHIYAAPGNGDFGLLLRNVSLSDDIAFRFDDEQWSEHPLTADKYASWIHSHTDASSINLFMDYETFGIHKKTGTGIFEFLENLPIEVMKDDNWNFTTPAETLKACYPKDIYDVPETISWKDKEIECCVWCENTMQNNMLKKIYSLENMLQKNGTSTDRLCWGHLQSADHFYYMSDAGRMAHDAYHAFNPFDSAEAAYKNYLQIITGFEIKLIEHGLAKFNGEHHYLKNTSLY